MSLTIELSPVEEARLASASRNSGLSADAWVRKLIGENSPIETVEQENGFNGKHWADSPTSIYTARALLAKWDAEDAMLTLEESAENRRIYAEIEKNGIPRLQH